jgi:hypothetical protein
VSCAGQPSCRGFHSAWGIWLRISMSNWGIATQKARPRRGRACDLRRKRQSAADFEGAFSSIVGWVEPLRNPSPHCVKDSEVMGIATLHPSYGPLRLEKINPSAASTDQSQLLSMNPMFQMHASPSSAHRRMQAGTRSATWLFVERNRRVRARESRFQVCKGLMALHDWEGRRRNPSKSKKGP